MMSIRGRLLALAIGGVLPLLLVGLTALWFVWSEKRNQLNESLEQQSELLAVVFDRWLESGQAEREGAALRDALHGISLPDRALVTLLDQNYRIVYRSQTEESTLGLDLSGVEKLSALNDRPTAVIVTRSSIDGVERVYGLSRVGNTGYVVMVGVQSDILYASAWRQLKGYAVVGLVIVFCTVAGALLIARSIARPVRLLSFAAEDFGRGNFSARAPAEGGDEMSRLGMNFNAMAESLQKREERLAELDRLKSEFV
ncbi:MAG TPA: HAMP domain-containing protein, partial [Pyrinomonadaceae bacterium]|nr:HAMP domain-containing protein [Pyrinomonadaceae bacterium]